MSVNAIEDPVPAERDAPPARQPASGASTAARWNTIEVRHLAALVAIADEGSFRRAADQLGYVQSAVSGQLAHLERVAGSRLVERASGASTVQLTAAGQLLLTHSHAIIKRLERAYADVSSLAAPTEGSVRVAGLERLEPGRLARLLRLFRQLHPAARVAFEEPAGDGDSLRRVAEERLDVVVAELPLPDGPFAHVILQRDAYVLLVAADCELASRARPPSPDELARLRPIVRSSERGAPELRDVLGKLGIDRQAALSPDSPATAQALVARGLATAILPRRLIDRTDPRTVIVELDGMLPEPTLVAAFHGERVRAAAVDGFVRAADVAHRTVWSRQPRVVHHTFQ